MFYKDFFMLLVPLFRLKLSLFRVSQMRLTGGGGQFGQNDQKLHENDKIDIGGDMGGRQANFLGSGLGPPQSPQSPH